MHDTELTSAMFVMWSHILHSQSDVLKVQKMMLKLNIQDIERLLMGYVQRKRWSTKLNLAWLCHKVLISLKYDCWFSMSKFMLAVGSHALS